MDLYQFRTGILLIERKLNFERFYQLSYADQRKSGFGFNMLR